MRLVFAHALSAPPSAQLVGGSLSGEGRGIGCWLDRNLVWTRLQSQGSSAHQWQMQHQPVCWAFKPLVWWEKESLRSSMRTAVERLAEPGDAVHGRMQVFCQCLTQHSDGV